MKKHNGQLIYSDKDEYGSLEVIDIQQRIRSLHFGNGTSQSAMFLYDPIPLIHKYTQALLTPLCWQQADNVLILGMGAGSISKFILQHFKHIKLDVVELRSKVINIAKEYFSLPPESENFHIHHMPAETFINNHASTNSYDLIIIDLFLTSSKNQDITVNIDKDYAKLKALLNNDGFLSINLIGANYQNYSAFTLLGDLFNYHLYHIDIEKRNTILLAGKQEIPVLNNDFDFSTKEKKHQLPWRQYFNQLDKARLS